MQKYLNENNFFSTSDMTLVTSIYYHGGKIETVDKSDPSRAVFIFPRTKELDALIQGFWSKTLLVEPQAFSACLREIKTRLYQG